MSYAPSQEQRWDHQRDLRKNDFDPIDRLTRPIPPAMEVASLVRDRNVPLSQATDLIEQYAQTVASAARVEAVQQASDRFLAELEKQQARFAVQP